MAKSQRSGWRQAIYPLSWWASVNPFSTISWFFRAWRGRSITFAALFASAVLGFSVMRWMRHVVSGFGAPWYVWLLTPIMIVSMVARKEKDWVPDEAMRARWSFGLIIGALLLVWANAHFSWGQP